MFTRRTAIITLGASIAGASIAQGISLPSYSNGRDVYNALAQQPNERLSFGDGEIYLVFADGAPGLDRAVVRAWVHRAAEEMAGYFGRFPVRRYGLLVIAEDGDSVGHASTWGFAGSITRIHVGRSITAAAFAQDWVLVHEMFHVALPDLPRDALWLQEGNATWSEPVARVRAGHLNAANLWYQALMGMPHGAPEPGEAGLDGTTRWGRLYWGGALFWLMAEIGIAQATDGRHSLRGALQAINRHSGGNSVDWTPEHMMMTGDAATNTDVLTKLHAEFAHRRVEYDLDTLFGRLGIVANGDGVTLDDGAPLAAIRRAITG